MKKFFGFGSSTPPPPAPPAKPPAAPVKPAAPAAAAKPAAPASAEKPAPAAQAAAALSIVGRWKEPNSSDTTEFHADGTVTEKTGTGDTIRGRYSVRDKILKINLDGVPDELSFPVAIATNSLEMTDPDGKVSRYERIS